MNIGYCPVPLQLKASPSSVLQSQAPKFGKYDSTVNYKLRALQGKVSQGIEKMPYNDIQVSDEFKRNLAEFCMEATREDGQALTEVFCQLLEKKNFPALIYLLDCLKTRKYYTYFSNNKTLIRRAMQQESIDKPDTIQGELGIGQAIKDTFQGYSLKGYMDKLREEIRIAVRYYDPKKSLVLMDTLKQSPLFNYKPLITEMFQQNRDIKAAFIRRQK